MTTRRGLRPGGSLLPIVALLLAVAAAPPQPSPTSTPSLAPASSAAPVPVAASPALLSVVDAAIAEGRLQVAQEVIARSRVTTDGPEFQLRVAELALASGDLPGAVTTFSELRDTPSVAARAQQGLGLARLRQGDPAGAAAALDAGLALDPNLARAWNARGVAADRLRDWPRADAAYARALALAPQSAATLSNRGYSLMLRSRFAEAETDLARAVALDPALAAARTNLRLARALQGHYEAAFAGSTRQGLAADLNTVGFAAMARGDRATAEAYFNRALELNPQFDRTAWANLQYLQQQGSAKPETAATLPAVAQPR